MALLKRVLASKRERYSHLVRLKPAARALAEKHNLDQSLQRRGARVVEGDSLENC